MKSKYEPLNSPHFRFEGELDERITKKFSISSQNDAFCVRRWLSFSKLPNYSNLTPIASISPIAFPLSSSSPSTDSTHAFYPATRSFILRMPTSLFPCLVTASLSLIPCVAREGALL